MSKKNKPSVPVSVQKDDTPVVYIGPSVFAPTGTIYNNGLPNELKEAINKHKELKYFVVKLGEANKARAELRIEGSRLNIFFNRLTKVGGTK